jgi:hypothetical protein
VSTALLLFYLTGAVFSLLHFLNTKVFGLSIAALAQLPLFEAYYHWLALAAFAVAAPFVTLVWFFVYLDLRTRKEGWDLELAFRAQAARLEAIVGLSQWLASPSHPSLATRQSWLADHLFALLPGVAQITVNPGFFADNYLRLIGFAAQLGIFPMPTGGSRNAPPSTEDIANVVVAALTEPERHAGRTYRPTGPTLLSAGDMAAILTRVLGRRVTHLDMPMWAFMRAARVLGISSFEQSGLRRYIEDHRRGAFEWGAPTADVWEVTGRPPEDFETIARRYASLPEARRTFGNGLRASADLLRIGLTPARNIDRYERDHHHPLPANPRLAAEDEAWRASHPLRVGPAPATPAVSLPA